MSATDKPWTVKDKWVIVTGANAGIGESVATKLACEGANVVLACRSMEKGRLAAARITEKSGGQGGSVEVMQLDLADGKSIQAFVKQYTATHQHLHLLINNAGLNARGAYTGPTTTTEGADICFGTNYLGHFLLCQNLLPTLIASAPSRIVNLGSVMHWVATGDFEPLLSNTGPGGYSESKLAMITYANELAADLSSRHPEADVRVFSVDPGFTASDIWRDSSYGIDMVKQYVMLTAEQGASTTLEAATQPDLPSGSHLVPLRRNARPDLFGGWAYFLCTALARFTFGCVVQSPAPLSLDEAFRNRLWNCTIDFWESHGHQVPQLGVANSSFRSRGWSSCYAEE